MSTTLQEVQRQFDEDVNTENNPKMSSSTPPIIRVVVSMATGLLFGIALEKGRVFEPRVIRDQMLFRRFGMMKMFLSASAVGILCFSFLFGMPHTMRKMGLALQNFPERPPLKSMLGIAVGAAILGSGMTIAGACPGTTLVQLGTGVENAWITVAGGLFGAVVYALAQADLPDIFRTNSQSKSIYLHQYLGVPYSAIAVPLSCALAGVVFALEYFSPWHEEIDPSLLNEGVMKAGAWPPFIAGVMIGALQIPTVLANEDTLGSSNAYVTLLSTFWPSSLINFNNEEVYLKQYRYGLQRWWQVIHVMGAVFGGALSATASNSMGVVPGLPWHHAFFGGFLMIFGSRLAGGCTSGHGLSGFGLLAMMSFAAVPAMFGGGIATAFFMQNVCQVEM